MILSCGGDQYSCLDTSNTKIHPLVMILSTVVEYFFSSNFGHQGGIGTTCAWAYHLGKINTHGQILVFEVSKQLHQSPQHERITWQWRHKLLGGENWN